LAAVHKRKSWRRSEREREREGEREREREREREGKGGRESSPIASYPIGDCQKRIVICS
jgi:hypothetical protein